MHWRKTKRASAQITPLSCDHAQHRCNDGKGTMNTKLVSSIEATTKLRLATTSTDTILQDVAKLLTGTQVSLVVVCTATGAMAGVITKTILVQHIAQPSTIGANSRAKDVMNTEVVSCRPDDDLTQVLTMMKTYQYQNNHH